MFARGAIVVALALGCAACSPALPPATQIVTTSAAPLPGVATVTFYWPMSSCDPAGYYSIAGSPDVLVARVARGTRATVAVPPGPHVFWAWNPPVERVMGVSTTNVALARISAEPGAAYHVRLAFGEWDDGGPRTVHAMYRGRLGTISQRCVGSNVALVALGPDDPEAPRAASVAATLPALTLGSEVEQDVADIREHRALGEARFARLRPDARSLATAP